MIHPTVIISKKAKISSKVEIGPYVVIGDNVEIGAGTKIDSFCTLTGHTVIGKNNHIFSNAVLGSIPQDLKYKGEESHLFIGDNNKIREFVTINVGTSNGGGKTIIGNNNLIMAYAHIAHDCIINNHTIIANAGTLAGHVDVEDNAVIGGLTGIHQFVKIGRFSIIGGCSKVVQDIPPYSTCDGHPAKIRGVNIVGLRRSGFDSNSRSVLKEAFKILFSSGHPITEGIDILKNELSETEEIKYLVEFIQNSKRGICI
ncbi:MAG: acyl-ACP--UDP-N-acetylglucosamine O-acyltransferase [Candidatus Saelkia tenebricola]|nr:acyl-ACP--UDP-N-acetylglucosamine O-acyltransferase [Candidatus Saelkia tenebricola]